MDKKVTGIVSYITIIGWLIAYCAGAKDEAKFTLNQSLVINVLSMVVAAFSRIPIIGLVFAIISIGVFVLWIIGLVYAIQGEEKEIPLVGKLHFLK